MTETALCCRERPEGGLDGPCTWPETDCYQKGPAMPNPPAPSTTAPTLAETLDELEALMTEAFDQLDGYLTGDEQNASAMTFARCSMLIRRVRNIPPGTPPPKITVEVWDGADQYPNAKVADVVRINDTWHVVAVIDD